MTLNTHRESERANRYDLGRTLCASCKTGKLAKASMWEGTAAYWYCTDCGHINRWNRVAESQPQPGEG